MFRAKTFAKFLILTAFFIQGAPPYAQARISCNLLERLFSAPARRIEGFLVGVPEKSVKEVTPDLWLNSLTQLQRDNFKHIASEFDIDIRSSKTPFGFATSLIHDPQKQNPTEEITKLYHGWIESGHSVDFINSWVTSEAHASFAVDFLNRVDPSDHALSNLLEKNRFFKDTAYYLDSDGRKKFITYGFEKEGRSANIGICYKVASFTDEKWLELPNEERLQLLELEVGSNKKNFNIKSILPTALKPAYLGPFSVEGDGGVAVKSFGWEVKSIGREISSNSLFENMKDLAHTIHNEREFHVHQVFEVPLQYKHFNGLDAWVKRLNDYAALDGIENGLHPTRLTAIPPVKNRSLLAKIKKFWQSKKFRPDSVRDIDRKSFKFWTVGLRGDIYGSANKGFKKIGLEFRDTARDLSHFQSLVQESEKSIISRSWENADSELLKRSLTLDVSQKAALSRLKQALPPKYAEQFASLYPECSLPYIPYENSEFYNYRTGKLEQLTPQQIARVESARVSYAKELNQRIVEIEELIAKGTPPDPEDVKMAIQQDLGAWAKAANPSEFFKSI